MNVIEMLKEIEEKCDVVEQLYHDQNLTYKEDVEVERWFELMKERFKEL